MIGLTGKYMLKVLLCICTEYQYGKCRKKTRGLNPPDILLRTLYSCQRCIALRGIDLQMLTASRRASIIKSISRPTFLTYNQSCVIDLENEHRFSFMYGMPHDTTTYSQLLTGLHIFSTSGLMLVGQSQ